MWKANEKVQAKILKVICTFESALYLIYVLSSFLILNPLIFILTLAIPLKKKFPLKRSSNAEFGRYNLHFLITHTGREADSGHYMAWSKAPSSVKGDEWFKFDDDKVSVVKEEIMKLGGGGDRPTAYMIFIFQLGMNKVSIKSFKYRQLSSIKPNFHLLINSFY